ncbi:MAG: hypothetical protein ACRDTD_12235 [Pseudonocardiaceae bacterium]
MTWLMLSMGKHGMHYGGLVAGSVLADGELVLAVSRAVRLDLEPGESPPDPDQICSACLRSVDAQ